jgi:hypothetical protein
MKKLKLPFGLRAAKLGMERANKSLDFRVGAALVSKGHVIIACNSYKTSPAIRRWYKYDDQSHAEWNLFSHTDENTRVKGVVYVYRELADGSFGLARPCKYCRMFLKSIGIRKVIYTGYGENITEERL